jgi:hypothetical protein|tara:strand:+ start:88 stop:264 length:177 start_codon:yes stop_codon:yes gene_type:complete
MKFSKQQLKKSGMYALAVASIVPIISGVFYLLSFTPAPIGFGVIIGLFSFPFFMMMTR